jgi:phosphoribosyl-dephospho-CoA transferase
LPVGVRGHGRARRHATFIESSCIAEVLRPTDLVGRIDELPDVAVKHALAEVTALLAPTGMCWGPGGSVGFTLATRICAVTRSSDLDVVLTVDEVPPLAMLAELRESFRRLPARVDCQLDLPIGGVALDDLLGPAEVVLVRTADGPVLQNLCREAS